MLKNNTNVYSKLESICNSLYKEYVESNLVSQSYTIDTDVFALDINNSKLHENHVL